MIPRMPLPSAYGNIKFPAPEPLLDLNSGLNETVPVNLLSLLLGPSSSNTTSTMHSNYGE